MADVGLLTATDVAVAQEAARQHRVVVTKDSDFGSILARTGERAPSVVLLRHDTDAAPEQQVRLIDAALVAATGDLADGAVVTVSRGRLRVRGLPIG